uniref:WD_REPEATS_REGION domain-containing protein n=1 Tax=Globodera rostochiensis TaxID=31243 RepID=A0A914HH00_GLORO
MSTFSTYQPQLSMFGDVPMFATANSSIVGTSNATASTTASESTSVLQLHGRQQPSAALLQQQLRMRKEIYRYTCDELLFAAAWSNKLYPDKRFRLVVGTLLDEEGTRSNKVYIIELDESAGELVRKASIVHGYPCSATQFIPNTDVSQPELFATTSTCLRIFRYHPAIASISQECELSSTKSSAYSSPLTNLDWNEVDSTLVATCSIDTTCTVWNIETSQPVGQAPTVKGMQKTQLIAHEKPVHDIAFTRLDNGRDQFATAGADGSIRLFDSERRMLNHLAWNKRDPTKLATVAHDSNEVVILDVRIPCRPMARFGNHRGAINGITWAPHSTVHLCTAGSDRQALIWQMNHFNREEPILAYTAESEICQIHWSSNFHQWISICFGNSLEILRV